MEPERLHIQNTEQLNAHDCHQNVTETFKRPQNVTQNVQTHEQHRNSESGYSSVKQFRRYVTHGPYGGAAHWQPIMCSARHMGHNVAYTKMAWTDEALLPQSYFSTYACPLELSIPEWLQRSNWGNNTSNGAIKVVGCSWSHLQYCKCLWTIFEVIHDARIHKNNNAWYICTNKIMYRYLVQQVH